MRQCDFLFQRNVLGRLVVQRITFPINKSALRGIRRWLTRGGAALCVLLLLVGCGTDKRVPGKLRRFDPTAAVAVLLGSLEHEARLLAVTAFYVRKDGTIDIKADYIPSEGTVVTYEFVRRNPNFGAIGAKSGPSEPKGKEPPLGVRPRPLSAPEETPVAVPQYELVTFHIYRPYWTHVTETRGGFTSVYDLHHRGMMQIDHATSNSHEEFTVPPPSLSFADVWRIALERDVPEDAVAQIRYDKGGYHFAINYTDISFDLDPLGRPVERIP